MLCKLIPSLLIHLVGRLLGGWLRNAGGNVGEEGHTQNQSNSIGLNQIENYFVSFRL